jgi:hypothetical protein
MPVREPGEHQQADTDDEQPAGDDVLDRLAPGDRQGEEQQTTAPMTGSTVGVTKCLH